MKLPQLPVSVLGLLGLWLMAGGCASPDVNPRTARTDRGYVDLFTQPKADVWWKVDVFDSRNQAFKEFTAQFKAPAQAIFRVEARPGRHKALISFVNQAVEAPAQVEIEVIAGMITPVEVKLEKGDSSFVRVVEDRARSGFATAGRNKATDYSQERLRISATVLPPVAYSPKENAAYWKSTGR